MKLFTKNSQHKFDPAMLIWADPTSKCPVAKRIWILEFGIPSSQMMNFLSTWSCLWYQTKFGSTFGSSCYDLLSGGASWTGQTSKSMNQCGMPHNKNGDTSKRRRLSSKTTYEDVYIYICTYVYFKYCRYIYIYIYLHNYIYTYMLLVVIDACIIQIQIYRESPMINPKTALMFLVCKIA